MKPFPFVMAAALVAAACASPDPAERTVRFSCSNGEQVQVRFGPAQDIAVLERGGDRFELRQQRAASGFWYSNGPNSIRGKGKELLVEIGRMVPLACKAA